MHEEYRLCNINITFFEKIRSNNANRRGGWKRKLDHFYEIKKKYLVTEL
jgi:hypothetical protein